MMMKKPFSLTAQLSTGHSLPKNLTSSKVLPVLSKAIDVVPFDVLIIGWEEIPDLFQKLTVKNTRMVDQVFLWYPMLSDYPGMEPDHLVVNFQGQSSQGWGEFVASGEMSETFRFACPNNPDALKTSLFNLERLLRTYDFDGVFLDKIRFPSPANGISDLLTCFCEHCKAKAKKQGLNLDDVRQKLLNWQTINSSQVKNQYLSGVNWLDKLLENKPLIREFIRFRCDSITNVVDKVLLLTEKLGKKLALDVFSPGFAALVGQDLPVISKKAVWVKPMIYRFAKGPASLRLEIPELVKGIMTFSNSDPSDVNRWLGNNLSGFSLEDINQIKNFGATLNLISQELGYALNQMSPTPVYLGIETVRIPGVIEISPQHVEEIIDMCKEHEISGFALSWDLLHTPLDNLLPLKGIR